MALTDYVTLNDLAQLEKDTIRGHVAENLVWNSKMAEILPLETLNALGTTIISYNTLPSMGFRKINENYSQTKGTFKQNTEVVSAMGGYIDADKLLVKVGNTVAKMMATQTKMAMASQAFTFNQYFIKGDRGIDEEQFDGLLKRIDDIYAAGYTGQRIAATDNSIMDTKAHALGFLHEVDELIDACDGGNPTCLLMNGKTKRAVTAALRMSECLGHHTDQYGRSFPSYENIPIYDMGLQSDQATQVMIEEANTGLTGSNYGSIIACKFGIGTHLWGIQAYTMDVTNKGELENGTTNRVIVDWPIGLAINSPRSVARMYRVKVV